MTKPLDGKLALVTGASKGIGSATAVALAAAGAHVILTGRDVRALEAVEDRIHEVGGSSTIAPVDLAESDGIARLASAIAGRWDKLDILVISAAYLPTLTPVTQIDGKQFSQAMTVNALATQALLANFDPLLKRADAGRVIGLTSSVGENPRAYWSAYGSTKAAFDNLLDAYSQEVEKISSVRVATIDPGATRTSMRAKAYPGEDPQTVKAPEEVANRLIELIVNDFPTRHRERIES
ncbi:SDR family NAD(P)-dependent oxidoreductase [Qipengyuania psychrotolerans]|uniref:SDR family NAD(P)-dependent oxidoreductase n=1 Tax=Qipengyuania psychrotolerans TaxID=2867238 RepID=A0ABX8ZHB5_9SPHN|nr:SDR family NAD(P)-dependent oxidoreductase [Qipengyuania psychrotolerans]QZD88126.1 SDR family NAD(P)-dependent oxidoreductase [Qipengyuania psychrotolerans]